MMMTAQEETKGLSRESLPSCEIWLGSGDGAYVWNRQSCGIFEFLAPSCGKYLFWSIFFAYFVDRKKNLEILCSILCKSNE